MSTVLLEATIEIEVSMFPFPQESQNPITNPGKSADEWTQMHDHARRSVVLGLVVAIPASLAGLIGEVFDLWTSAWFSWPVGVAIVFAASTIAWGAYLLLIQLLNQPDEEQTSHSNT